MPTIELPAGPISYGDTGGSGPVLVLAHGVPMDHRAWRKVVPLLTGFRVITPTLPLGGHRLPMRADADLSQRGVARVLVAFIEALDLDDVTLVLNDWGGGQFLINDGDFDRIGRLVLVACEAFDNFPPGPAKLLEVAARVPGGMWAVLQAMRLRPIRRMRSGYGGMSVRGIPDELLTDWFRPSQQDPLIRRDFVKFASGTPGKAELLALSEGWSGFARPVLVVWARQDRLMPAERGPRLAALYPDARLEWLDDCATLAGEDQPERLAALLSEFVTSTATAV
ncbi:alpha/beta fold hydrolase [Actinomycetota bacterium]